MEPVDLRQTVDLFIASDILDTARELQTHLASVSYDEQPEIASQAIDILGDPRELYDSKNILIHALGARILLNGLGPISVDEQIYNGIYFGDAYIKARFSRFAYVQSRAISGICLSIVEAKVLSSKSNPEFDGEIIRSGVYVPVHAIEMVLVA